MRIDRRSVLVGGAAGGLMLTAGRRVKAETKTEAPILTDDGLYKQSWFIESLLELPDDLDAAAKAGKRFAIMWELRGCPYCKETHFVNFAEPRIADYVRANFDIVQLNIIGSRKVTDFDGEELSEKALAAKYGVRFTPTFQFFPDSLDGLKAKAPAKREVARIPGYLRPDDFLAMFRYVRAKAYETKSFLDFVKSGA